MGRPENSDLARIDDLLAACVGVRNRVRYLARFIDEPEPGEYLCEIVALTDYLQAYVLEQRAAIGGALYKPRAT
jgi:hypothetical protein